MNHLLNVKQVSKVFAGVEAVNKVSFELYPGEIVALTGHNGAGKSSLLNLVAGIEQPDSGTITYNQTDITRWGFQARARAGIALYFQRPRIFRNESCINNLIVARHGHPGERLIGNLWQRRAIKEFESETHAKGLDLLRAVNLESKAQNMAGLLSGGQQKLLYLSMLLMNDPKILLLDEPFANVSQSLIQSISRRLIALADSGKTLLIVEHHIAEITAISRRVFTMDRGSLSVQTSAEVAT